MSKIFKIGGAKLASERTRMIKGLSSANRKILMKGTTIELLMTELEHRRSCLNGVRSNLTKGLKVDKSPSFTEPKSKKKLTN